MTIYILKAFDTPHKWGEGAIIGYFTSKAALRKAIQKYAKDLGLFPSGLDAKEDKQAFWEGFNAYPNRPLWSPDPNNYMETGLIERVTANEYPVDGGFDA